MKNPHHRDDGRARQPCVFGCHVFVYMNVVFLGLNSQEKVSCTVL